MPNLTHLTRQEADLANRFIKLNPINAVAFKFDEHVGQGMEINPDWPPYIKVMTRRLTQRRLDMLAVTPTEDWIIELKPRGNAHAIGQLLLYQILYQIKHPTKPKPRLAMVAPYLGFDLAQALDQFSIAHFVV